MGWQRNPPKPALFPSNPKLPRGALRHEHESIVKRAYTIALISPRRPHPLVAARVPPPAPHANAAGHPILFHLAAMPLRQLLSPPLVLRRLGSFETPPKSLAGPSHVLAVAPGDAPRLRQVLLQAALPRQPLLHRLLRGQEHIDEGLLLQPLLTQRLFQGRHQRLQLRDPVLPRAPALKNGSKTAQNGPKGP